LRRIAFLEREETILFLNGDQPNNLTLKGKGGSMEALAIMVLAFAGYIIM